MDDARFRAHLEGRPPEPRPPEPPEQSAPPVQAPILSRVIILRNAFSPKLLVRNPYLDQGEEAEGPRVSFPEVERDYISVCAQYGYVRYTQGCIFFESPRFVQLV